jgi:hypothetical protein
MATSPQPALHGTDSKQDIEWQRQLLPLMSRMVKWLAAFFFIASFAQLMYLHWKISRSPALDIQGPLSSLSVPAIGAQNVLSAARLKAVIVLEANGLEQQYHQANVLLMSRIWTSYLGFVTGMILSLVGASFVLGKLREPTSELTLKTAPSDVSFRSASPGLILAVLGTLLMLTTIVTNHRIETTHRAVYLRDDVSTTAESPEPPPPPLNTPSATDSKH